MKKTIAILLALMLCLSLAAVPAMAAEEQIAIVAKVPSDWVDPCAWAWGASGNAFNNWPGELMTDLGDGWYYIYVPAGMTGIIINGNGGSVQTLDGTMDGDKDAWVTIGEAGADGKYDLTVSYEKQNDATVPAPDGSAQEPDAETPDASDTYTVHASVPESWTTANLWAWSDDQTNVFDSWPGQAMNLGEDGWYTWDVPTWATNVIVNNGSSQTVDIPVEAKDLWLVVAEDNSYTLSYEGAEDSGEAETPDEPVDEPTTETVTVHAWVPESWADPCVWAWDDNQTNAYDAWPGELMTKDGDWYTLEVPAWVCNVIVNGNGGSVQTIDLAVEAGKEIWVVVDYSGVGTVSYEEPAELPEAAAPAPVDPTDPVEAQPVPKESNAGLIAGIVIGVVGVVGSVAAVVVSKKKNAAAAAAEEAEQ